MEQEAKSGLSRHSPGEAKGIGGRPRLPRASEASPIAERSISEGSAYAGATGKILLAHCPQEIRSRILSSPLQSPRGAETIDRGELVRELDRIRAQGFAFSREEWMPHAGDISVPIFYGKKTFLAQLGMAGIAENIFRDFEGMLLLLKQSAHNVERKLQDHYFGGGTHVPGK